MTQKAPGKHLRKGLSLIELFRMFPDEETARRWFESMLWPNGPECPHCGCNRVSECKGHIPMPYRCKMCQKHFSVRKGTVMEKSPIPLQKWAIALYLCSTSLKGVSSMKLHRDLNITQKTAWFMLHRIREAMKSETGLFSGPVKVDDTTIGGERKNMPKGRREKLTGHGAVGKTAIVGMRDRASNTITADVVTNVKKPTLQGFVKGNMVEGSTISTDENRAYGGLPNHESVKHSVNEYVRGRVHTNGIESFWAMLKRAHKGTFHKMSKKHLQRYVTEFVGHHKCRLRDTIDIMGAVARGMDGRRLCYGDLIADNGLASGARSSLSPVGL